MSNGPMESQGCTHSWATLKAAYEDGRATADARVRELEGLLAESSRCLRWDDWSTQERRWLRDRIDAALARKDGDHG